MKKMKRVFTLLAAVIFTLQIQAQCITGMPNDTVLICQYDLLELGGNPTLTGGVAPFTYSWSITPITVSFATIYASDFLNDTTLLHPILNSSYTYSDSLHLYLTITDINGLSCTDTFLYEMNQLSNWVYFIHTGPTGDMILLGDSMQIYPNFLVVDSAVQPVAYAWSPSTNLSDSTNCCPWSSATTYTRYDVIVTDANGCQATDFFEVYVNNPNAIDEQNQNKTLLKITDVLGRKSKGTKDTPLFYIYDDGTVEKKIIIE
jgi:hypothetical protein